MSQPTPNQPDEQAKDQPESTGQPEARKPEHMQPVSILSIRFGPLSLRAWLFILLSVFVGFMYYEQRIPDISNREYLQTMLGKNTLERTAGAIVRDAKEKESKGNASGDEAAKAATDARWTAIANGIAACMQKEAQSWLASDDPFLSQHLTRESPRTIAMRLIDNCHAMQYMPQARAAQ